VKFRLRAWYHPAANRNKKKLTKYDDTLHRTELLTVKLPDKTMNPPFSEEVITFDAKKDGINSGVLEAILMMQLSDETKFIVSPDYGFGHKGYNGYCGTVPPDATLTASISLMQVHRDGIWHNRKQVHVQPFSITLIILDRTSTSIKVYYVIDIFFNHPYQHCCSQLLILLSILPHAPLFVLSEEDDKCDDEYHENRKQFKRKRSIRL
jgi:FKBP-type peptidyl-prolyl cis-trans isomerase